MASRRKTTSYYDSCADNIRFKVILDTCWSFLREYNGDKDSPIVFNTYSRIIGTILYEMTPIHSGLISERCIRIRLQTGTSKKTDEHFMGRQQGGEKCLNSVLLSGTVDPQVIKGIVDTYRQVHYTSAEENTKLNSIIKANPGFENDWRLPYRELGIKLGQYVPHQRANKYDLNAFKLP